MKTLKKVLSLVLVVAMIASMLIVGAAAADEKTNYEEAVAVVTGIGIIEGDENGMNYQGTVTREQAAKIISYLLLGKTTAESLKTSTAPFADVAASRWSAGYIAYLKGQGIISGVSDTEFDPTAPVSGIAFAKMLLVAAGYGANGEFDGKGWDINTITFANENGIFEGTLAADLEAGATREEAMLYAFNLLTKVPVVKYNKTFESYYTGTSALNPVEGVVDPTAVETEDGGYTPYYYTLAWQKYELMLLSDDTYVDEFGRPAAVWNADGVDVADTVANAIPDTVLYGSVNHDELYNAIGKVASEYFNKNENWNTIDVYRNGSKSNPIAKPIKAGYTAHTVAGTGNGAVVEVYVDYEDGHYDVDLVIWYEQIATVTKVAKVSNTITLTGNIVVSGEDFDISGYAKNDVVIYTKGTLDTVSSIRPAGEPVVGTYINHTLYTYNIDGASVYASAVAKYDTLPELADKGTAFNFYYDSMGNILMAEEYDEAAITGTYNYVYVKNVGSQFKDDEDLVVKNDSAIILEVVYAAGGKATVNYEIKATADGTEYIVFNNVKTYIEAGDEEDLNKNGTLKIKDNAGIAAGCWYTYTTNEDGEITLKTIGANQYATEVDSIAVETGKAYTGTGFAANSKTVLTVVDENGVAVVYNGIANFPEEGELEGEYEIVVTHSKTGTAGDELAKSIIVYAGSDVIASAKNYVYVVMAWSYDDENVLYWAYQDGTTTFIDVERPNVNGGSMGGYEEYIFGYVCELKVEDGENVLTFANSIQNGANISDENTSVTIWYEIATVDTVDDTYFTTVAVKEIEGYEDPDSILEEGQFYMYGSVFNADFSVDEDKTLDYAAILAANTELFSEEGYIMTEPVESITYYYDAETVIYDAVNGGYADGIAEGDNFIAIADEDSYCEYIWIVG